LNNNAKIEFYVCVKQTVTDDHWNQYSLRNISAHYSYRRPCLVLYGKRQTKKTQCIHKSVENSIRLRNI